MGLDTQTNLVDTNAKKVNSDSFADYMITKMLDLNQKYDIKSGSNVEVTLYYDTHKKESGEIFAIGDPLDIVKDEADLKAKEDAYKRIGTVGNMDLESFKIVRLVDKDLQVYEIDDGKGMKYNLSVYQHLSPRIIKRTMIDSSFGILSDVKDFLVETAIFEKWYSTLEVNFNEIIKGDLISIDPMNP